MATIAHVDAVRDEGPSNLPPFPADSRRENPPPLPSEHGALLADLLIVRPWDPTAENAADGHVWGPPFEPSDAADRHLVVSSLAESIWGPRYAGAEFTGSSTVLYLVDATAADGQWLDEDLATQPLLADSDVAIVAVDRSLSQLETMADAVTAMLPHDLADQVEIAVDVGGNAVSVVATSAAVSDETRRLLEHAPAWVEMSTVG